jgi:hypothetical protein
VKASSTEAPATMTTTAAATMTTTAAAVRHHC